MDKGKKPVLWETNDELRDQEQQEQEKLDKFPRKLVFDKETKAEYRLTDIIGTSYDGIINVYRASRFLRKFKGHSEMDDEQLFAVKIIRAVRGTPAYDDIRQRVGRNFRLPRFRRPHLNIMGIKNIFTDNGIFCVVFPHADCSVRSLMRSKFPNGMPQEYLIGLLREALRGLLFLHQNEQVHGEISAGQIFDTGIDDIQLSFGAAVYDHGNDQYTDRGYLPMKHISTWASAPEVYPGNDPLINPKTDIWMIGITALELACGEVQIQDRNHLMSIVNAIKQRQRILPLRGERSLSLLKRVLAWFNRFNGKSTALDKFVCKCLATDPAKRPTASQLLNSELFSNMEKS